MTRATAGHHTTPLRSRRPPPTSSQPEATHLDSCALRLTTPILTRMPRLTMPMSAHRRYMLGATLLSRETETSPLDHLLIAEAAHVRVAELLAITR